MTAWAQGLTGFSRGFQSGYDVVSRIKDRNRALEAERLFGDTLRTMYAPPPPQPMPGESTGMPMQAPMRPGMNIPGATPMPGGSPAGMPPGPVRPQVPMPPGPQTMQRPGATPMGSQFETMQTAPAGPPSNLDWKSVLTAVTRQNPQADPAAIARVVDRVLPLMNSQSQMEWRELSGRIRMLENERKTNADERRFSQGDRRLALAERNADALASYRERTIAQRDREIAQTAKKDPEIVRQYDATKTAYAQAENNYRAALKGVSDAEYNMDEAAKSRAYAELEQAEKARDDAWTRLETFAKTPAPTTGGPPATRPLRDAVKKNPIGTSSSAAAAPGAVETSPEGEQFVRTKTGTKAQIGNAPPPKASGVAPAAPPAATGGTRPAATVSAEPTGPAPQAFPLPKDKAMMVKNRRYNIRVGDRDVVYTWDGTQLVKVKTGGGAQ